MWARYMVICHFDLFQYSLAIWISWCFCSGWKPQYHMDSGAHTIGRWNRTVMDILSLSKKGSTIKTLESLQVHFNRNFKLPKCNQNGILLTRFPLFLIWTFESLQDRALWSYTIWKAQMRDGKMGSLWVCKDSNQRLAQIASLKYTKI